MAERTRVRKARAIVIKERDAGESGKQLILLAKGEGKLAVSARGAKNQKSKFLSGAQPFSYCDFVLYDGGGFLSVTQLDLLRSFQNGFNDIYKMMYGSYFLELIDRTVMYSQEADDIMLLLISALHVLGKTDSPKKVSAVFQIKLLGLLGFLPETGACAVCGGKIIGETVFTPDGFACAGCTAGEAVPSGILEAFDYISGAKDYKKAFMFTLPKELLERLNDMAETLIKSQLEIESGSLLIIKKL